MVKVSNAKKLWQDIENDSIIKEQMAYLGCLLVCTFCNLLAPVLVPAHTGNNLDFGDEQGFKNEGYESDQKNFPSEYFVSVAQRQKELPYLYKFVCCILTPPGTGGG